MAHDEGTVGDIKGESDALAQGNVVATDDNDSKLGVSSKGVKVKKEKDGDDDNNKKNKRIKTENVDNSKGKKTKKTIKVDNGDDNQNKRIVGAFNYGAMMLKNMPKYVEVNDVHQVDKTCLADLVLVSEDDCLFAVHSNVLYAASSVLRQLILELGKTTEETDCVDRRLILRLEDVIGSDLSLMLRYIYQGRLDIDVDELERLNILVERFGMAEAKELSGFTPKSSKASEDDSFFEELRKGGVMKTEKGGQCLICGAEFTTFTSAKRHLALKHEEPDDLSKLKCHLCGKQLTRKHYLVEHLRIAHNIKKSVVGRGKGRTKDK